MSNCWCIQRQSVQGWVTAISLHTSCELLVNWTHVHMGGPCKVWLFHLLSTSPVLCLHNLRSCIKAFPKINTFVSMCVLPFVETSVKKASSPLARPSYLYICCGRLAAPACSEAVLLNGGLVANWLLLQSGLWLCPWVIRGAVKREPLEHCQWTREGMPARCRPARENAAGDAQIPQRQRPCKRCRELRVEKQERQKKTEKDNLSLSCI